MTMQTLFTYNATQNEVRNGVAALIRSNENIYNITEKQTISSDRTDVSLFAFKAENKGLL